ncbi:hypothetical protein F4780DRAFT_718787 [Xylariomycetidae sp. FL0641]|nr:hypothetical protein F4780DRAFT_718787 [Xylariomycetidae sp. FL0641]
MICPFPDRVPSMGLQSMLAALLKVGAILLLVQGQRAHGLSWRSEPKIDPARNRQAVISQGSSALKLLKGGSHSPSTYDIALNELQLLESQPLCHRTAARLLVNNCQLLEDKDEKTILTDSGRKIQDFVDSYAASLAICDLERANFNIPRECTNFREPILSQLPIQNVAQLHVDTREVDSCLAGLGTSDSAWNTWVSYRHKALMFCEAARADNDRSQHILLFQRLTKIMSNLADDVDEQVERRMRDLDSRTEATGRKIDNLSPQLDRLRDGLNSAEAVISGQLAHVLKRSTDSINDGVESAQNLQRMLQLILQSVMDSHAEMAYAHDQSLQTMHQRTEFEMGNMMTAMTAVLATTTTLQNQIEHSRLQSEQLETRQDNLEQGMQRLIGISENLAARYDEHTNLLHQAQNITNEILDSLDDTAASAATISNSFLNLSGSSSWWPYVWCPAASLVLGSYGLPPSALRNFGLVALGESMGFALSSFQSLSFHPSALLIANLSPFSFFSQREEAEAIIKTYVNDTIQVDRV